MSLFHFFKKNNLKTSKRDNFNLFIKGLTLIKNNEHLNSKGLIKIAKLTEKMNHKKSRKELIRILRDQTSDSSRN